MNTTPIALGYIPLVDAAPLIVAREIGFAEQEGLSFELRAAPSWSTLRDLVALGRIEAAHMLSPVPVAMALGLGGLPTRLDALMVLSVNGNAVGVSAQLAERMRAAGHAFDFADATAAGTALMSAAGAHLRIGVPFPFSMHAELLYYWLSRLGMQAPNSLDVHTVPPQMMAEALAAGDIDAFCVGAPWGSIAVDNGSGELLLPTSSIWSFAPEKVLAARHDWIEENPDITRRLIRAIWRAARWLGNHDNRLTASEILARKEYLDLPAELLERSLTGNLEISPRGVRRNVPSFLEFHDGAANFPWRSQASWIAAQLAARTGLDRRTANAAARAVFRSDVYREALASTSADLPGASDKLEGALEVPTEVPSQTGSLILCSDRFFDGTIFTPDTVTTPGI